MFTVGQILQAIGYEGNAQVTENVTQSWPVLVSSMKTYGIYDHYTQIAVIATVAVETGVTEDGINKTFLPVKELGGENASYAPWFGRGYIQCTWESNYAYYGPLLSPPIDLLKNPDALLEPVPSAQMAALYFKGRNIQAHANAQNWQQCRIDVNGGLNGYGPFLQVVQALLGMTEAPDKPPVTKVSVAGTLKTLPTHESPPAVGPDKKEVELKVGTVVKFTPDPHDPKHLIVSADKLWAHVDVEGTPEHGWFLRESLITE